MTGYQSSDNRWLHFLGHSVAYRWAIRRSFCWHNDFGLAMLLSNHHQYHLSQVTLDHNVDFSLESDFGPISLQFDCAKFLFSGVNIDEFNITNYPSDRQPKRYRVLFSIWYVELQSILYCTLWYENKYTWSDFMKYGVGSLLCDKVFTISCHSTM